ncbi:MAG TPA: TetR family transcriptional regulator [Baekduia sp.]|uniref:TetR/AcrR family transcriptional regulator n=1 Tax=Baekduia sp. TaxID=2600305 RepID=UPI002D794DE3|nr:TetR family transcriptional regulator [Baekduia sp.]HET6510036.1 TetR family transcriptional regulator [Baekduia sp.]
MTDVDATNPTAPALGRRERKKLQTRQALAEAALKLILERGYDAVTVAEIAEEADTAVTTLFKHFPEGKESLIFHGGVELELGMGLSEDRSAALAAAIRERGEGVRVLDAIEAFIGARGAFAGQQRSERFRKQLRLVAETPALRAYALRLWMDCQDAVIAEMAAATGRDVGDPALRALARFALETPNLFGTERGARAALHDVFDRLRAGWPEL